MNLILLFKEDFIKKNKLVRLSGRRFKHIVDVQNATVKDELRVGLSGDNVGTGLITYIDDNSIEMEINLYRKPPAALPVTLILALPRPRVLKRIFSTVTSMGVKEIILINAYRVEKSFLKSPLLLKENYDKYLILGLEQARDTTMPEVLIKPLFKPFVEDELKSIIKGSTPIVAHPSAENECPTNVPGRVTLVIGPEGGFIPYEIEKLKDCGFADVNLGERILSVETAVPVLLSKLF